jgi:hypothetical protein
MSSSAIVTGIFFTAWIVITIIGQFQQNRLVQLLKRYDFFALIPTWTFFAPNPAVQDFSLLFRDKDVSGQLTAWKVFVYRIPPPGIRGIWNPAKRRSKAINDMATVWLLIRDTNPQSHEYVLSIPYLCLLHQILVAPREDSVVATQMAVASVFSHQKERPAEILVVSAFHKL